MSVEEFPEFQTALNEACEKQYRGWLFGGSAVKAETSSEIEDLMKKFQHKRDEAKKLRKSLSLRSTALGLNLFDVPRLPEKITEESMENYHKEMHAYTGRIKTETEQMTNAHMREITKNLKRKDGISGLICPVCGEGDHGNRMNGKPVCLMNAKHKGLGPIPLMTPKKAKDWKPPTKKFKPKASWQLDDDEIVKAK